MSKRHLVIVQSPECFLHSATAFVIGVGGFLGIGETHVLVPFNAVTVTDRDGSTRLVMNSSRDELTGATRYRYDKNKHLWLSQERRDPADKSPPRK